MRIAFTADWHIGVATHSTNRLGLPSRTRDAIEGVRRIVQSAENRGCDVLIVGGDLFHHPNPRPMFIDAAVDILQYAERKFDQIFVIAGNHDPRPVDGIGPIGLLKRMLPQTAFIESDLDVDMMNISVAFRPYQKKVQWLRPPKDTKYSKREYTIMVAHHHFAGAVNGSECTMLAGGVSIQDTIKNVDLVLSGHIHKPQIIKCAGKQVLYPGSPARFDFGDRDDPRGFFVIDTEGDLDIEFVEITSVPMVQIEGPVEAIDEADVDGADVKVIIKCETSLDVDALEVYEKLKRKGARYVIPIQYDIHHEDRTRDKNINRQQGQAECVRLWVENNDLGQFSEDEVVAAGMEIINEDFGN